MVRSFLNDSINYHETKALEGDDYELNASIYEVEYLDVEVSMVVGNQKYTFIEKGVIYLPIYLVFKGELVEKIGIYEFLSSDLMNLLDEEDDIDIGQLGDPLLFSYINKDYLEQYRNTGSDSETSVEEEGVEEEGVEEEGVEEEGVEEEGVEEEGVEEEGVEEEGVEEEGVEEKDSETEELTSLDSLQDKLKGDDVLPEEGTIIKELFEEEDDIITLKEESELEHNKEIEEFNKEKRTSGKNWMQKFMKNTNYSIIDNEGGGDCLFAVIRDAFENVGKSTSVAKLRKVLASEATQEQLDTLLFIYNSFVVENSEIKGKMKELVERNAELKKQVNYKPKTSTDKPALNRTEKKKLVKESKENVKKHRALKKKLAFSDSQLEEYAYLDGVTTLDEFKEKIQTCTYWGETWTISTLERILNIKIIVLSSESYKQKDYENVLQCGQLNDTILEERGVFKPKYYIMTDWMGWHYKTIAYKGKKALTYEELPYGIKTMIFDKCLERMSGPYALIPKFIRGKEAYEASIISETGETSEELSEDSEAVESLPEKDTLYDSSVIFQIYQRSANKAPGKGIGETISTLQEKEYLDLRDYEDWRRKLSNHYETPFTLDGKTWNSITHFVTAQYFKHHKEFFNDFSLDSETELGKLLSKTPEMVLSTLKDKGLYRSTRVRPVEIEKDQTITAEEISGHMVRALHAKFSQHKELKDILLATKMAKIMLFIPRKPSEPFMNLMKVRKEIQESEKEED